MFDRTGRPRGMGAVHSFVPKKLLLPLALIALVAAFLASQAPAPLAHATDDPPTVTTVVVKPSTVSTDLSQPTGWTFYDDTTDLPGGPGAFVTGPGTPPLGNGTGSAAMTVDAQGRESLLTSQFDGVKLADITTLSYASYVAAQDPNNLSNRVYLMFDVNFGTGSTAYQGRLSFTPSSSTFANDEWQTWNPMDTNASKWFTSKNINSADGHTTAPCYNGTTDGCSWDEVKNYWPNATIGNPDTSNLNAIGNLVFRVGNPGDNYTGNVDNFHIVTTGDNPIDRTFDFEPETQCTTTCYVDADTGDDSFGGDTAASAKKTIQAAVNQVSATGTVNVAAGTYNEDVKITTAGVTLHGADAATTIIKGTKGDSSLDTVYVGAVGATVDGFTITRDGNNVADWNNANGSLNNQGVTLRADNTTITNSIVTGNRNGVYVFYADNVSIRNNDIIDNRTGIQVNDGTGVTTPDGISITENNITENWTLGILFNHVPSNTGMPTGVVVNGNNISGNWYGGINDRFAGAVAVNAVGNWFGSNTPSVLAGDSSEPDYASQIPAAFGGTAAAPATLGPDIIWSDTANTSNPLRYIPWSCSGTDTDTNAPGFTHSNDLCVPGNAQPPSGDNVHAQSAQTLDNGETMGIGLDAGQFTASYTGTGSAAVVLSEFHDSPTSVTNNLFTAGSQYYDVFAAILESDPAATLTVVFPSVGTGQQLRWFDGTNWLTVLTAGGVLPAVAQNGDTTVVFSATSSPRIDQLTGTPIATADANAIAVQFSSTLVLPGQQVTATIVAKASALQGVHIDLSYDPALLKVLSLANIELGRTILPADTIAVETFDDTAGTISFDFSKYGAPPASGDDIVLATITFTVQAPTALTTTAVTVLDTSLFSTPDGTSIPLTLPQSSSLDVNTITVKGQVFLQGRGGIAGTKVTITDGTTNWSATTDATGAYSITLPSVGTYTISAVHDGYLRAGSDSLVVSVGVTTLATSTLLGGDANGDGAINILDITAIATNYLKASNQWPTGAGPSLPIGPTQNITPDINGDGTVNIFDLTVTAGNYQTPSIIAWPAAPAP